MASNPLLRSSVIAALGGLLFGFDAIVISGVDEKIQALWNLSDILHGWVMASALVGTVVGALAGNFPTDRFGRKKTLQWIGVLYLVSAVWSGLATDEVTFMIARFLGGLGVGVSTVAAPLYISEIAPPEKRGLLAGMFQFNIVFGILLAYISNSLLDGTSDNDWRWMLGVEAFPAILYTLLTFAIPESPRWLIGLRGQLDEAEEILARINPGASADEIRQIAGSIEQAARAEEQATHGEAFSSKLRTPILLAFLVAMFNQLSGINAILYFAPRILGLAAIDDPRVGQISIGLVNLVFTMIGLWLIDRVGRKTLLLVGSLGYIASLALVSAIFFANQAPLDVAGKAMALGAAEKKIESLEKQQITGEVLDSAKVKAEVARKEFLASIRQDGFDGEKFEFADDTPREQIIRSALQAREVTRQTVGTTRWWILAGILVFMASHAVGQGAVIWVLISEVFPNEHRAIGNSIGSSTHWLFAALITAYFPTAVGALAPGVIFAFFCGMMVLHLIWVLTMVPETKGVPLEEIQRRLGVS